MKKDYLTIKALAAAIDAMLIDGTENGIEYAIILSGILLEKLDEMESDETE